MQALVVAAVPTDAFLKAMAGGVVKQEKAKLRPHVSGCAVLCCAGLCWAVVLSGEAGKRPNTAHM